MINTKPFARIVHPYANERLKHPFEVLCSRCSSVLGTPLTGAASANLHPCPLCASTCRHPCPRSELS
jgi:hypothetical protein